MKESLQRIWSDRTPRERWIFGIGAAVLATAFAYAYLWLPVARQREQLIVDLPLLRAQSLQMHEDSRHIARLLANKNTAPKDLQAALSSFPSSNKDDSVTPQITTEANGRLRVAFPSVLAGDWLSWISAIALEGFRIETVRVDALNEPGMIKTSASFASAGQ